MAPAIFSIEERKHADFGAKPMEPDSGPAPQGEYVTLLVSNLPQHLCSNGNLEAAIDQAGLQDMVHAFKALPASNEAVIGLRSEKAAQMCIVHFQGMRCLNIKRDGPISVRYCAKARAHLDPTTAHEALAYLEAKTMQNAPDRQCEKYCKVPKGVPPGRRASKESVILEDSMSATATETPPSNGTPPSSRSTEDGPTLGRRCEKEAKVEEPNMMSSEGSTAEPEGTESENLHHVFSPRRLTMSSPASLTLNPRWADCCDSDDDLEVIWCSH